MSNSKSAQTAASDAPSVELERYDAVAVIALNRPHRRNALDMESRVLLASLVEAALADPEVRVVVLTGRGGHFCSGGDIGTMKGSEPIGAVSGRQRMRDGLRTVECLLTSDKPVLAAVEGVAYGGGFGIALAADMVIASQTARFCMSFARVGLVPDSASLYTLPRIVGLARAKELMMSARELDATTAKNYGIAMEVVPTGQALVRALQIATALAQTSPVATAMAKTALNNSLSSDLRSMLEYEATAQGVAFASDWHRAAVARFIEKQPPLFTWPLG